MQSPTAPPTEESIPGLLGEIAEETLASGFRWLHFPKRLERQFADDSTRERVARFRFYGVIALVLINLYAISDRIMVPDIANRALVIRAGVISPLLILFIATLGHPWAARRREWLVALLIVATSTLLVHILTSSHHPNALQYHTGSVLLACFGPVAMRQRFWFALGTCLAIAIIHAIGMRNLSGLGQAAWMNSVLVLVSSEAISLLANYQMERDSRHNYLETLLQRIARASLLRSREALDILAKSDSLTGLSNRRSFDASLQSEWNRAKRGKEPLAAIFVDVDRFKEFNDTHGHLAGDACLAAIAAILQQGAQRTIDLCARYGGEEFVVLLPQTHLANALHVAERLCRMVEQAPPLSCGVELLPLPTISCGVASLVPDLDTEPERLLQAADQALYLAKRAGRNRVVAISA